MFPFRFLLLKRNTQNRTGLKGPPFDFLSALCDFLFFCLHKVPLQFYLILRYRADLRRSRLVMFLGSQLPLFSIVTKRGIVCKNCYFTFCLTRLLLTSEIFTSGYFSSAAMRYDFLMNYVHTVPDIRKFYIFAQNVTHQNCQNLEKM